MTIIRATLAELSKVISVREDQIEDALASDRLVKLSMSRRGFFRGVTAAAAALALPTGIAFSELRRRVAAVRVDWSRGVTHYQVAVTQDTRLEFGHPDKPGVVQLALLDRLGGSEVLWPPNVDFPFGKPCSWWNQIPGGMNLVSLFYNGERYYAVESVFPGSS